MATPLDAQRLSLDQLTVHSERPSHAEWGSDLVADMLRLLGIDYIALNPGASYRGFHDSLINYNGNQRPSMILCNHEDVAVAVAHGYAKLAGRPMAASLHSNVGLLHGSMGIFDAFVDRQPILILGGTGPMDSTRRRPWIDWIHTANGQGGAVRDFTKWEHQPASVEAIPEAMLRAWHLAVSEPAGPVYICLDAGLQEQRLDRAVELPDLGRYPLPASLEPAPEAVRDAVRMLAAAQQPVLLLGQAGQTPAAWDQLRELAELLAMAVVPDNKGLASFPTDHYLHHAYFATEDANSALRQADTVLSLGRIDVAGTIRAARGGPVADPRSGRQAGADGSPRLIHVSVDHFAVRSWTTDYFELPAADLAISANIDRTVGAMLEEARRVIRDDAGARHRAEQRTVAHRARRAQLDEQWRHRRLDRWDLEPMSMERVVAELRTAMGNRYEDTVVAKAHGTWPSGVWDFTSPGSYMGGDGGAGVGSGPGMAIGVALAAMAEGRPVVSFHGDGDTLMAPEALWTAAHHRIPLLYLVVNNRSYYNDEEHQQRVAEARERPVANRWIGQRMDDPAVDFGALARSLGAAGFGPISDPADLAETFNVALANVQEGTPAVVDLHIRPR